MISSGLQPLAMRVSAHSQDPVRGLRARPGPQVEVVQVGGWGVDWGWVSLRMSSCPNLFTPAGAGGGADVVGGGGGGGEVCCCEGRRGLGLRGGRVTGVAGKDLRVVLEVSSSSSRLAVAACTRTAWRT